MGDRTITISEKELLGILASECANVVKTMGEKGDSGFNFALALLMATFSAKVTSKIFDKDDTEENSGYHYSERGEN